MRGLLFDLEGTTTSLAFVKDELFPYARRRIPGFLHDHRDEPAIRPIVARLAQQLGTDPADLTTIGAVLQNWIDEDRKDPDLKELQGFVWEEGYRGGAYQGHLYPDVVPFWERARAAGALLAIYSSGSEQAQRLLLQHSGGGDVSGLIARHFDTRVGAKTDPASYARIATSLELAPPEIEFFSDAVPELDAARAAGLRTCRVLRPGVPRLPHGHPEIATFSELDREVGRV